MLPHHHGDAAQRKRKRTGAEITENVLQSHAANNIIGQPLDPNQMHGFNASNLSAISGENLPSSTEGNWWQMPAPLAPFQQYDQYQPAANLTSPCTSLDNMLNCNLPPAQAAQLSMYTMPFQQFVPSTFTYPMAAGESAPTFAAAPLASQYSYSSLENSPGCEQATVPELQLAERPSHNLDPKETVCFGVVSIFEPFTENNLTKLKFHEQLADAPCAYRADGTTDRWDQWQMRATTVCQYSGNGRGHDSFC